MNGSQDKIKLPHLQMIFLCPRVAFGYVYVCASECLHVYYLTFDILNPNRLTSNICQTHFIIYNFI